MRHFTTEQKLQARNTDLYSFLLKYHGTEFVKEGNSLRMRSNHSISIKEGYHGYMDFGANDKGNSVDFLVNHLGYQMDEAVFALSGEENRSSTPVVRQETKMIPIEFPENLQLNV